MPKAFSCPNPTCAYTFPADAVQGAASLSCPACGTVYRFRQAAPTPRPTAKPLPPVPPPVAPPVAAPVMPEPPSELAFPEPGLVVRTPGKRASRRRGGGAGAVLKWGIVLALVNCIIGGIAYFVLVVMPRLAPKEPDLPAATATLSFNAPSGWHNDKQLLAQMKANMAMSRSEPRAEVALFFRDYQYRLPGDAELVEEAAKRLKAFFPRVEYSDPLRAGGEGRTAELGGEKALAMKFKATSNDQVPMRGECLMTARRGLGYWLMAWVPEGRAGDLPGMMAELSDKLSFGEGREGWKPTPRPATPVVLADAGLRLAYPEDMWKKEEDPRRWDAVAELGLRGYDLSPDKNGKLRRVDYAGKLATLRVLVLPRAADLPSAMAAARALVQKKATELHESNKLVPYLDPGSNKPVVQHKVGKMKGEIHHLDVVQGDDVGDAGILAVVNTARATVAIWCECQPDRRGYWTNEFMAILDSIQPR